MLTALAFLTPLGGARTPNGRTLDWFPLAGVLVGAATGTAWWLAAQWWPPLLAAALVVAVDLALTGMLHFDGLVDSADGLLAHLERDRRLAVMAEPTLGAFGLGVGAATVALRLAALASMTPSIALVAAAWCGSRSLMALGAGRLPYARGDGLARVFTSTRSAAARRSSAVVAVVGLVGALALAALVDGPLLRGPVSVAVGLAAGVAVLSLAQRRIGGFTGDVLGAAGVVTETVALVVAAGRW